MSRACIAPFVMAGIYFVLAGVFHFLGGAIDQPHPEYVEGDWITHRVPESIHWAEVIAVVMFLLISADLAVQHATDRASVKDMAFFPRLNKAGDFLRLTAPRWLLIGGAAFLALYWGQSLVEVRTWRQINSGWVWPPERFFVTCLLAWGLVWIADCLRRPRRTTIFAAVGFTLFVAMLLLPAIGAGVLRE